MLLRIVKEINECLSKDCYLAALFMALTLPDICGKAEFPQKASGDRSVLWYEQHVGRFEREQSKWGEDYADTPYLSAELYYALRCSVLHSGDVDVNGNAMQEEQNKLAKFTLSIPKPNKYNAYGGATLITYDQQGNVDSRELEVDIPYVCRIISRAAEKYYKENAEKFIFFKYNIDDKRVSHFRHQKQRAEEEQ